MQKYIWDTNALIKYYSDYYPIAACRTQFQTYASEGRCIVHQEVKCELQPRLTDDDDDTEFVKLLNSLNCILSNEQSYCADNQAIVKEIASKYQNLFDNEKDQNWADPWLVAHAKNTNSILITEESQKPEKVKIPSIAKVFGVEYIKTVEFFAKS